MHLLQGAAARMAVVAGRREGQMGVNGADDGARPQAAHAPPDQPRGPQIMTSISTNQTARPASFLSRLVAAVTGRRAQLRAYRGTRRELSALNDRELTDLGISRGMIEEIATQAARRA